MPTRPTQVADGVHRVADGLVNWYLLVADGKVTLIDTGWPRSWSRVQEALSSLGHSTSDLAAVVLTHGHPDHQGAAERARQAGAVVHGHRDEVPYLKGEAKGSSPFAMVPSLIPHLIQPKALGFILHATAHGFMTPKWIKQVTPFDDGQTIDVPGSPRALHTPGHTTGHTSFILDNAGAVLTGDALVTLDVFTRETGPRLLPDALNADSAAARASLDRFADVDAQLLLPGHGDPLTGNVADLAAQAKSRS
ncbi:MAG: MBL fold metallo-hydrolase [Euzebya sp.]